MKKYIFILSLFLYFPCRNLLAMNGLGIMSVFVVNDQEKPGAILNFLENEYPKIYKFVEDSTESSKLAKLRNNNHGLRSANFKDYARGMVNEMRSKGYTYEQLDFADSVENILNGESNGWKYIINDSFDCLKVLSKINESQEVVAISIGEYTGSFMNKNIQ